MVARAALFLLLLGLAACNTTPLGQRDWLAVETHHFDIVSSLSEERTAALASDLEAFRHATEYVVGRRIPTAKARTRVYAFDDRGFDSKFEIRREPGYLVPRLRGDLIVLRGGGGWAIDATVDLRLQFARQLFRRAGSLDLPPWYDEGFAQLASTLVVDGSRAKIGILNEDHVRHLQRASWVGVNRVLTAADLEDWPRVDRDMFDAESWAIAHYLGVGSHGDPTASDARKHYLAALAAGSSLSRAAATTFGDSFDKKIRKYATEGELDSLTVGLRIDDNRMRTSVSPLTKSQSLAALGRLSLAIERPEQAKDFFWDAASEGPKEAALWAGTGSALSLMGHWPAAQKHFQKALEIDDRDPLIHLDYANAALARANETSDPAERTSLVELSREHLRESLSLRGRLAETHAVLAASHLVEGQDAAPGLSHIDRAIALSPASLEARLTRARLQLRANSPRTARQEAVAVLTRARDRDTIRSARDVLAEIDSGGLAAAR